MLADAMQRQEASDPERALGLVRMAAEKAPDRADIAWLYSQLCAQVAGCQPETAEARLRRLDPGNASVWLGPLTRAREAHDAAAENEILEAMSHGERFDVYWNSLVSKVAVVLSADTASQLGPQSPDLVTGNLNDAVGWISSIVVPRFTALSESCSTARMTNPAIAQRCSAISEALGRGDSYIAESFGLAIAERLAAPGSRQAMTVAEQIRRSRYQRDTAGQIITSQVEREKFSREMLKLMESLRREQDVFLAVIRWSGQPTEPTG
ncbi:MAG TPA: hypothetical protein VKB34_10060 [Povalibacter sp.]|nr:hypothetical protein [Povalibacter sp.]